LQWTDEPRVTLNPIHSVRNADGIKAHELLRALRTSVDQLREIWAVQAQRLRDRIPEAHWLDDVWGYPGVPRFFIVLENMEMNHTDHDHTFHASRLLYMSNQRSRAERQGDWVDKELMDFRESDTGRHPITWDAHFFH
jgi:hypothetical protein